MMVLEEPLSARRPALRQGAPMSGALTTGTIIAEGAGGEGADDLRASTGILIGLAISCALWAGIVAAIVAVF